VHASLRKLGVLDHVEVAETYDEGITLAAIAAEKAR
jgi:hypothetical protein